jgi:energy-coupling factor transport system permease protein
VSNRHPNPQGPGFVRQLHAGAWWLWALGLAAAATRTLNPLVLVLIIAVAGLVTAARRTGAPWAASFRAFLALGAFVVVLRVVFEALFGAPVPGTVLVTLPELTLPAWMADAGEALVGALCAGLQLAAILACVGAASALAAPTRLLKSVPGALYEVGVALVVALTVVPQTVVHVGHVREARRLRGRSDRGLRAWAATAVPVLNAALERSLLLAAAMDSRGFGRSSSLTRGQRRVVAGGIFAGMAGVLVGVYGLLAASTPGFVGLALVAAGATVMVLGVARAGRRSTRTVYRPDPWGAREWLCAGSGLVAAAAVTASAALWPAGQAVPATWPPLPLVAVAGVLTALLPAWVAPAPARATSTSDAARIERGPVPEGTGAAVVPAVVPASPSTTPAAVHEAQQPLAVPGGLR